jgi:hypothetical protein
VVSRPSSTPAAHRADLAVDPVTGLLGRADTGGSTILFLVRLMAGGTCLLVAVAGLAYQYWIVAVVAAAIGLPLMRDKRGPSPQQVGVWVGECPRCATLIHEPASAFENHYRFACPGCRHAILLKDQRFEAARS